MERASKTIILQGDNGVIYPLLVIINYGKKQPKPEKLWKAIQTQLKGKNNTLADLKPLFILEGHQTTGHGFSHGMTFALNDEVTI